MSVFDTKVFAVYFLVGQGPFWFSQLQHSVKSISCLFYLFFYSNKNRLSEFFFPNGEYFQVIRHLLKYWPIVNLGGEKQKNQESFIFQERARERKNQSVSPHSELTADNVCANFWLFPVQPWWEKWSYLWEKWEKLLVRVRRNICGDGCEGEEGASLFCVCVTRQGGTGWDPLTMLGR